MNSRIVSQEKNRLDEVFKSVSELLREIDNQSIDLQMQSHLAKYLCIVVSAFLEKSIRAILYDFAKSRSAPSVSSYVEDQLRFFYNAKTNKILELAGTFDPKWRSALEHALQDEVRDALDTIVDNKNKIAHGQDSQITFVGIRIYYERALKLLELLEHHCA
jgi:hypothetical protein